MYNAVLVLGTQQSDSVIYNMYLFFFRLFPFLGYYKTPKYSFIQGKEYIKMDTPFVPFQQYQWWPGKTHIQVCVCVCVCVSTWLVK